MAVEGMPEYNNYYQLKPALLKAMWLVSCHIYESNLHLLHKIIP